MHKIYAKLLSIETNCENTLEMKDESPNRETKNCTTTAKLNDRYSRQKPEFSGSEISAKLCETITMQQSSPYD